MLNFSFPELTIEELEKARDALNAEIDKRREEEVEKYKAELRSLLNRVNELQDMYGFEISCIDDCGDWVSSALDFGVVE